MRFIALTFKNIKKFLVHHPIMFVFLFIVQVVCCVAVFITCGMAYNMDYVEKEDVEYKQFSFCFISEDENYNIAIEDNDDGTYSQYYLIKDKETGKTKKSSTVEFPTAIPMSEAWDMIEEFKTLTEKYDLQLAELMLYPRNVVDLQEDEVLDYVSYYPGLPLIKNFENKNVLIYAETSERVILAPAIDKYGEPSKWCPYHIGETSKINGIDFKCVAYHMFYVIPYKALPPDFALYNVNFVFGEKLYAEDIAEIINIGNSVFGTHIKQEWDPEPYDPLEIEFTQMMYVISIVVMIIVILAISKFYGYILSERKESLAILRLCGCTRGKVHAVYMLEIFLTMLVTSGVGYLLFRFVFFDYIAELYPAFTDFYKAPVYLIIIGVYMLVSMLIMAISVIPATKASITDMKRT